MHTFSRPAHYLWLVCPCRGHGNPGRSHHDPASPGWCSYHCQGQLVCMQAEDILAWDPQTKDSLQEWSNFKQRMMTSGWSAIGGQVRPPCPPDHTCLGLPHLTPPELQTQSPYVQGGVLPDATPLGHSVSLMPPPSMTGNRWVPC